MSWSGHSGTPGLPSLEPEEQKKISVFVTKYQEMVDDIADKYGIDQEEVCMGTSDIPPNDPTILVYVQIGDGYMLISVRKAFRSDGRWICRGYWSCPLNI